MTSCPFFYEILMYELYKLIKLIPNRINISLKNTSLILARIMLKNKNTHALHEIKRIREF